MIDLGLFVSLDDAGEQMGVSARTVRRLVEKGKLNAYKFERSIRVSVQSLARYIADCKVESLPPK